jgi:hypothetical protein
MHPTRFVVWFSWLCCCADRSARRSSRSSCSGTSWRSCAGSRGECRFDPSIARSSRRSRCREAPGRVCRCVRRRCCVGTVSWSGGAGPIRSGGRGAWPPQRSEAGSLLKIGAMDWPARRLGVWLSGDDLALAVIREREYMALLEAQPSYGDNEGRPPEQATTARAAEDDPPPRPPDRPPPAPPA